MTLTILRAPNPLRLGNIDPDSTYIYIRASTDVCVSLSRTEVTCTATTCAHWNRRIEIGGVYEFVKKGAPLLLQENENVSTVVVVVGPEREKIYINVPGGL